MAAGRDMIARLILTLTDRATSGLRALQSRIAGIAAQARRIAGIGILGGALTFGALVPQAAAFEDVLRQTAITAGRAGPAVEEMIRRTQARYEALALATGQRSRAIAEAAGQLIAAGLQPELIEQLLPTLARTATATGATLSDLSSTAIALNQNLRIGPQEMASALAALAQAGKEGRFELRDMARSFPQLTAAAEALGLRGREGVNSLAAMLQVARRGAATADEAANNLANFLQKITGPETVKHFREMGVDLQAVLADAARRGINPVEAVVQKIRELSRGNMFRVGELFGDLQVLNFLRPVLRAEGVEEYLRVLQAAGQASRGLIDTDFESRARGMLIQLELLSERIEQLGRRVALAAGTNLPLLNEALRVTQEFLADVDQRFPGAIDATLKWGAAIVALVAAFGAIGTIVGLLNPIGAAVGAIAAAVLLVVTYWEQVRGKMQEVLDLARRIGEYFRIEGGGVPQGEIQRRFNDRGRARGFYGDDPAVQPQSAPGPQSELKGKIEIALGPGLVLRRAETENPGVSIGTDRGLMLRPV